MTADENENKRIEEMRCDRCGRPAAMVLDGQHFCAECSQLAGSCCMEFGGDDLWAEIEDEGNLSAPPHEQKPVKRRAS